MPAPLRAAVAAASSLAVARSIAVRGGGAAGDEQARLDILGEFGGQEGLCKYFGWTPRSEGSRKPNIHYATIVGNNGQQDVYDINFAEIGPFVSTIVALDPAMTHRGKARNLSMDMSEARWQRYLPKLRHVVLESPIPEVVDERIYAIPVEQKRLLQRPGREYNADFGMEQWIRAQLWRGLRDGEGGAWSMDPEDIVIVADSDEIPLRESLLALSECESPNFARVRRAKAAGSDMREACSRDAKVLLRSQFLEYYVDCPIKEPIWWHPDAILATCVMEGGIDMEDVRTGSSGAITLVTAARHLHNIGMSMEDVIYKYMHYVEASNQEGVFSAQHEEMKWRACDPSAPPIGPTGWHARVRPATDMIKPSNARGWSEVAQMRRGADNTFALLKERPELAEKFYWKGHGEKSNPYVGGPAGENDYSGKL